MLLLLLPILCTRILFSKITITTKKNTFYFFLLSFYHCFSLILSVIYLFFFFVDVTSWIKSIDESVKREDVEVFLVGNKIDLEEKRTVPTDEGKDLAKTFGVKFLETSAKTGENVEKVFSELAKDVYKKQNAEPPREAAENQTKATGNVAIGSQGTTKSNGCC